VSLRQWLKPYGVYHIFVSDVEFELARDHWVRAQTPLSKKGNLHD